MASISVNQRQKQSQLQTMRLSQNQILGLRMLAMGSAELRREIYKQAEENPALEIASDPLYGDFETPSAHLPSSSVHTGIASAAGDADSDAFQKLLENRPDERGSLHAYLERQLNLLTLSADEYALCRALIHNLDSNGHHILSPINLVRSDTLSAAEKEAFLEKCLAVVQHLEPAGVCCANVQESLELQSARRPDAPFLARFFLHGHLDLITPPVTQKIHKKLLAWISARSRLVFTDAADDFPEITKADISNPDIEAAVAFIRTLDPYPARNFEQEDCSNYADADIFVTRLEGAIDGDDFEAGLIFDTETSYFQVSFDSDFLPKVRIAQEFSKPNKDEFIKNHSASARDFISNLVYREISLVKSCSALVKIQIDFFKNGTGHLTPLTQKDFARVLEVHESTVSRLADNKYIRCQWGVFPIKYFFTSAVPRRVETKLEAEGTPYSFTRQTQASSDTVRQEISAILKSADGKGLSDQKIADILTERGYKIARRTVAKYRAQLNIGSSYMREE